MPSLIFHLPYHVAVLDTFVIVAVVVVASCRREELTASFASSLVLGCYLLGRFVAGDFDLHLFRSSFLIVW